MVHEWVKQLAYLPDRAIHEFVFWEILSAGEFGGHPFDDDAFDPEQTDIERMIASISGDGGTTAPEKISALLAVGLWFESDYFKKRRKTIERLAKYRDYESLLQREIDHWRKVLAGRRERAGLK